MFSGFSKVWLLALVSGIALSAFPMMMLIGSIIGTQLAPSQRWATLPIALMVIGTACGVLPATRSMEAWGRRSGLMLFLGFGMVAAALAGQAMAWQSFSALCIAAFILGTANAALQQIRFAAMECVPIAQGPVAASIIMCAGIAAAFVGPELAMAGQHLSAAEYRGSFWLVAGCFAIAGLLLLFYQPATEVYRQNKEQARSTNAMLQNPRLLLAIASGATAFMVMSFVMTATPISMHLHHGHSMEDTKWVIQSHIAAMFLPSLATIWLFRWFSPHRLMVAGLCCYTLTIAIGLYDASVLGFWGQLVMLGIGWNFLFVSGTAMLPTAHAEGEQFRAQAINDSVVFSSQAIASLAAGWAMTLLEWREMLLINLLPMAAMAGLLLWQFRGKPDSSGVAP